MKRAERSKAGKRSKKTSSLPMRIVKKEGRILKKKAVERVDLGVVREQIRDLVGNRAVAMVETTMGEVKKGHYLAMKYLFEMVGLCPATSPEEAVEEDSLAKTLLRRLNLSEETNPGTEVTKECHTDPAEPESDAVK
jgi:hypothetical protein